MWFAEQIANWAAELDAITTPDGRTLLDHTIVVWSSETGDPNGHRSQDVPFVIVGGGAANLNVGQFLEVDRLHTDLLVSLGRAMGLEISTFGNAEFSATEITELRAP